MEGFNVRYILLILFNTATFIGEVLLINDAHNKKTIFVIEGILMISLLIMIFTAIPLISLIFFYVLYKKTRMYCTELIICCGCYFILFVLFLIMFFGFMQNCDNIYPSMGWDWFYYLGYLSILIMGNIMLSIIVMPCIITEENKNLTDECCDKNVIVNNNVKK